MPTTQPLTHTSRLSAPELAGQLASRALTVIDVREPVEFAAGHIEGSLNVPLGRLAEAQLPAGPLVLVCHSGNRSSRGQRILQEQGHPHAVADLEGGVLSWEEAGMPLRRLRNTPMPLIRQVQIAAGLVFAGISGFCGVAWLLALMPWNRVSP